MSKVLFVCLHNAGRSQMSEVLFNQVASPWHEARAAGTTPAGQVHPEVVAVMREEGLDLQGRVPVQLTDDLARWADVVVTMGCGDACPYLPGKRYLEWELPDPRGRPIEEVRQTRERIKQLVSQLARELTQLSPSPLP